MVRKILVRKRGYKRRSYVRSDGTRVKESVVKPTSYLMRDRGLPGRGEKLFELKSDSSLGGPGFFKKGAEARRKHEVSLSKKIGKGKVIKKLNALYVLQRRTNPTVAEKARNDMKYLQEICVNE